MSEGQQYLKRKVINWSEYNKALVARGSITLWFDDDIADVWFAKKTGPTGRGLDKTFSDEALRTCLLVRARFGLTLRSMEGFVNSVFGLMGLPLGCPHYTLFSKPRGRELQMEVPRELPAGAVDIVIDSTGLKVFGEGEWKVRKHGVGKRRTWRKLHLGIDPDSHQVIAAELTTNEVGDNEVLPELLEQLPADQPIDKVYGDGAYDALECYDAIEKRKAKPVIPPRRNAVQWEEEHPRTQAVQACEDDTSRREWKREVGYLRRSLGETAMYRFKTLISANLRSRRFDTQQVELHASIAVLNRLTSLGMPQRA